MGEGLTQSSSGRIQGPLEDGEPLEAWLFQAVDSESSECPGSGQPPAHEGVAFGKVGFSRLFNYREPVLPLHLGYSGEGVRGGEIPGNPPCPGMCPPQGSLFGDLAQEK